MGALVQLGVLPVFFLTVFNMRHDHQRRACDEDQLQRPQTDVGYGEDEVIADVGAAGLQTETHMLPSGSQIKVMKTEITPTKTKQTI